MAHNLSGGDEWFGLSLTFCKEFCLASHHFEFPLVTIVKNTVSESHDRWFLFCSIHVMFDNVCVFII